jgi:hypothetical protein
MRNKTQPLQVKAIPVGTDDSKLIDYCAKTLQEHFGYVFPKKRRHLDFFLARAKKLMKTGTFFIIYLPALTKRGDIPIGLFQIEPAQIACFPEAKSVVLKNVCTKKEIWGQGLGTSLLMEVLRIASEKEFDYLIGHVLKFSLIGTFYKMAHPISGRIANSNYLGISTEPLIFDIKANSQSGSLQQFWLYKKRRRHSFSGSIQPENYVKPTSKL